MKKLLAIFIIVATILYFTGLPIKESLLLASSITLIYFLRLLFFFSLSTILLILLSPLPIKWIIIISCGISLFYWIGIILFTDHKSHTWMYVKSNFPLNYKYQAERNKIISETYQDGALNMFFDKKLNNKKNKTNKNN